MGFSFSREPDLIEETRLKATEKLVAEIPASVDRVLNGKSNKPSPVPLRKTNLPTEIKVIKFLCNSLDWKTGDTRCVPVDEANRLIAVGQAQAVKVISTADSNLAIATKAALNETSGTAGGYTVPYTVANIVKGPNYTSFLNMLTDLTPEDRKVSEAIIAGLSFAGSANNFNEYGGVIPTISGDDYLPSNGNESDPTLIGHSIKPGYIYFDVVANNILLADGRSWESIQRKFASVLRFFIDLQILNGTTPQIPGIMLSSALISATRSGGNVIAIADVATMLSRVLMDSTDNLFFACSPSALAQLLKISAVECRVRPESGGKQFNLLGIPLFIHHGLPALGTPGDIILVNGAYYGYFQRTPITVVQDKHVKFLGNQSIIRTSCRFGGSPLATTAVTPATGSSLSPFVALTT